MAMLPRFDLPERNVNEGRYVMDLAEPPILNGFDDLLECPIVNRIMVDADYASRRRGVLSQSVYP